MSVMIMCPQDTDEFILSTGANKTRGLCCITGAVFGAVNGFRMGLSETRIMAWSKPRNVQILCMVTRQGATWANTLGSVALLYSAFGVILEKARGAEQHHCSAPPDQSAPTARPHESEGSPDVY
uniref:Uncharacterized protein n=1 Tax=Cyprinus carpio TaxID=7962 RepID=A0A8C2DJG5_CYPCA